MTGFEGLGPYLGSNIIDAIVHSMCTHSTKKIILGGVHSEKKEITFKVEYTSPIISTQYQKIELFPANDERTRIIYVKNDELEKILVQRFYL